jgi:hypothetical protein
VNDKQARRKDGAYLAALLLLTTLMFLPYLLPPTPLIFSNSNFGTDLAQEFYPLVYYLRDTLHQTGTLPLWRTYHLSGTPLVGHPVAPVFYPVHWLMFVLPIPLALNFDALLHIWWAGAGVYLCLRLLRKMRPDAALLGALLFAHTPRIIGHLTGGHWGLLTALAWWAWVWLAFHRYMQTRQMRWAGLLGVALAAQALNDGKYLLLSAVVLLPCAAFYVPRAQRRLWIWDGFRGGMAAFAVMFGLSAAQLLPLIELLPITQRTALTFETSAGGLPALLLTGMVLPFNMKIAEWVVFVGVALILLLLYSAACGWGQPERWWVWGIVLLLILNLGAEGGLYTLFYRFVPGFTLLRSPERFFPLALFGMAILAAEGAQKWLNGDKPARWMRYVCIVLSLLYIGVAVFKLLMPQSMLFYVFPHLFTLPLIAIVLLRVTPSRRWFMALTATALVDIWWFNADLARPQSEAEAIASSPVTSYLREHLTEDERVLAPYGALEDMQTIHAGIARADGYDPTYLSAYGEFIRTAGGCDFRDYSVGAPPTRANAFAVQACPTFIPNRSFLALLNIRYVVLPFTMQGETAVMSAGQQYVYAFERGVGRVFGVSVTQLVEPEQCVERLQTVDVRAVALVETLLSQDADLIPPLVLSHSRFANGETFSVRGGGLLVRSESWAMGWRATVDSVPAEVLRVDCTLQGVWLNDGDHIVRFEYLPQSFVVGSWITRISMGIFLLIGVLHVWRTVLKAQPTAKEL